MGATGEHIAILESYTATSSKYLVKLKATSLKYEARVLTNREMDTRQQQRFHLKMDTHRNIFKSQNHSNQWNAYDNQDE